MKKLLLPLFLLLSLSFGCSKENKPDHLLSPEQMTQLLYDLTIENSKQSIYMNADSIAVNQVSLQLLKKYGLDSASFVTQHRYYLEQPELYATMFDSIQRKLQREIVELEAQEKDTVVSEHSKLPQKVYIDKTEIKKISENGN